LSAADRLASSIDVMSAGIEIIDGHFSLAKADEVGAHQRSMLAALQEYRAPYRQVHLSRQMFDFEASAGP